MDSVEVCRMRYVYAVLAFALVAGCGWALFTVSTLVDPRVSVASLVAILVALAGLALRPSLNRHRMGYVARPAHRHR